MIDEKKVPVQEAFVPLHYDGTFESAKRCHQHLWDYLARTGEDKPILSKIKNNCYACQYVEDMIQEEVFNKDISASVYIRIIHRSCDFCPIKWQYRGETICPCNAKHAAYCMWCLTFDNHKIASFRREYAAQVRDMEFEDTRELLLQRVKELVKEEEEDVPLF